MKKTRFIPYLLTLALLGTTSLFAGSGNMVGPGSVNGGAMVDDDHILWGTGPNQVSLDDVPNGISVKLGQDASPTGTPTFNSINLTVGLGIASGGTGATTAAGARTNLGLGTIATQNANAVAITGGSIVGITDLAIADGGTNASTAAGARANLGAAASGANSDITSLLGLTGVIQAPTSILDSSSNELLNFSGQASAINELTILNAAAGSSPQILGSGGDSDVSITLMPKSNGRVIVSNGAARTSGLLIGKNGSGNREAFIALIGDDTNDPASQGLRIERDAGGEDANANITNIGDGDFTIQTLGAGSLFLGTNGSPALSIDPSGQVAIPDVLINGGTIAGITPLNILYGGTGASTDAGARTNLGLGTIATQDASTVAITGGSITGITPLAVAEGGTNASTAAGARASLGVPTVYQNQTIKTAKIWTGAATTTSGVASFFPTDDNTSGGTAIFSNIYSVQATAENNTGAAVSIPIASVKLIAANKKTITVNSVTGLNIVAVGDTVAFAPDGTNIYLTIIGD